MATTDDGGGGPLAILAILGFVLLALSPLIARAMQAAVSRKRETLADVSGVELTRYPPGLISALEKLRDDYTVVGSASHATAHLWIEQPMATTAEEGRLSRLNRMFDTHPPLEERIALPPRALTHALRSTMPPVRRHSRPARLASLSPAACSRGR